MNNQLITAYLTESEYAQWNALVTSSAQGSIYSTPEYLDALCEAAGGSFKILAVKREEEILGGVGLYQRGSGSRVYVSPRLLLYYNGLVFRNYDTKYPSQRTSRTLEIMGKMEEALNTSYCDISLRNRSSFADARLFTSRGWKARLSYTYVVPVGDLKSLWERVEQNLRRLVNRCTREGVQMTDDDDIEAFIQMHQQTVERKGTSLYLPPEAFRRFFKRLKSQGLCRLYHARLASGQSISAQLVLLGHHPVSHSVSAAADSAFLNMGATAFLRWKVFEALNSLGYTANDLTDAALNAVTHFKSQLGGDLETCLILERSKPVSLIRKVSSNLLMQGRRGLRAVATRFGVKDAQA